MNIYKFYCIKMGHTKTFSLVKRLVCYTSVMISVTCVDFNGKKKNSTLMSHDWLACRI